MNARELAEKTMVLDDPFRVYPITWRCGSIKGVYSSSGWARLASADDLSWGDDGIGADDELVGYYREPMLISHDVRGSLPVEFFNHQLMECNPEDEGDLRRFLSEWGFPYHPFTGGVPECVSDGAVDEWVDASGETAALAFSYVRKFPRGSAGDVISACEARSSIRRLQDAVTSICDFLKGVSGDVEEALGIINSATCNPCIAAHGAIYDGMPYGSRFSKVGLLTPAICNQIVETLADDAPWRECACDGCGRIFKRKQTDGVLTPSRDSIYCCKKCEERQKKRNQRAEGKR